MKRLHFLAAILTAGAALLVLSGCESTSMHETPAGKNVRVEGVVDSPAPSVSPVYLTPY